MPGPINNNRPPQFLQGIATPEDSVEIINVSENPEAAENGESFTVSSDQWSRFSDNSTGVQEGDHLKVRVRSRNGNATSWLSLQATGLGEDTRNAQIYADAVGLEANESGTVDLIYLGDGMLSEPGATVRFTNERTGENQTFTIGENGHLPPDTQLNGKAGDQISIAVSDGTNNVDFSEVAGVVGVEGAPEPLDLDDPGPWKKKHVNEDGTPSVSKTRFNGPLFVDGPTAGDVKQGSLANCYFSAAAASVADTDPEKLQEIIKDNNNGTYTVTFQKETYPGSGRFRPRKVTVDGELYVKSNGKPLYGGSIGTNSSPEQMEMWYPILEKAYAQFQDGSYDNIGNGGHASFAMSSIMGSSSTKQPINEHNMDRIYNSISRAAERGNPMTATTYGKDSAEAERYPGTKIYPWHTYSVLGVEESDDGKRFVKLRNPWGNTEPGYDGKNDGFFKLELEKFAHLYRTVSTCRG